jgi:hypothetical protein
MLDYLHTEYQFRASPYEGRDREISNMIYRHSYHTNIIIIIWPGLECPYTVSVPEAQPVLH